MEPREPDVDQLVPRVERPTPAYRIGRDIRSRVEGVKGTETIEPRSDFLDASVDQTDARKDFVPPNGHHYLLTEAYLNGNQVAAILRRNTRECELSPEAVRLRRNGVNIMTGCITSCRCWLKPSPRTRFTFSSVALSTIRPRFYALVEQAHEFRHEDVGDPRVALEHQHDLVVPGTQTQDVEN
jgi:hypothetical protein